MMESRPRLAALRSSGACERVLCRWLQRESCSQASMHACKCRHRVYIDRQGQMLVRPSALELQVRRGGKMKHHWLRTYRAALVAVLLVCHAL